METKQEHSERPMQYDTSRDILNTPPPSLVTRTNLLIISIILIVIACVSFIKLPMNYTSPVNVTSFPKDGNLIPIIVTETGTISEIITNDRTHVKKKANLVILTVNGGSKKILAPITGELIYQRKRKPNERVSSGDVLGWIKGDELIKSDITLIIQPKDIIYFPLNQEVELNDELRRTCTIEVNKLTISKNTFSVEATTIRGNNEFDFSKAHLRVSQEEKTLLEQFTTKQN